MASGTPGSPGPAPVTSRSVGENLPALLRRLRIIGTVLDPVAARAILLRLAIPTAAPALARARDPTELVGSEDEQEPLGA